MTAIQRIDRVRRDYNRWVANQTFEDFALRFTAKKARRFSAAKVGQTAIGATSFLALEAIGGSMTLHYGFTNTMAAFLAMTVTIIAAGVPICFYAAEYGVDVDLLTRGAGFGYIGSTITSLIYASFTFILLAIEASIMAIALELCLGVPLSLGYVVSALIVIPLVVNGVTAISSFQVWTQPIWIVLNIVPVFGIVLTSPHTIADWTSFAGSTNGSSGFQLLPFGAAASIALAFVVQLGEQVDYLRFLPPRRPKDVAWWIALLSAGPGWIIFGAFKLLAGSFLAVYLIRKGFSPDVVDPAHMYAAAFGSIFDNTTLALAATCVFVTVCQLKINVTNAYAGSIAWSNFFSRLTHHHPGRVVWLVFNVVLALLVMELGVYHALEETLGFYSSVAVAWIGAVVADLVINKPLGLSPPGIEFKRAYLYDINPVGVGAMTIAAAVATAAQGGLFGPTVRALAPFLSLAIAFVTAPAIAIATRGRYYLARQPEPQASTSTSICCVCENEFEVEDIAHCPAYGGPICSLCCSLDARCQDLCKPHGRLHDQLEATIRACLPEAARARGASYLIEFAVVFAVWIILAGALLLFLAFALFSDPRISSVAAVAVLWKALLLISIIAGVVSWLLVLGKTSGRAARGETHRQTRLLMEEIDAHRQTDLALKKAKEVAEAANFAKSRYVVGLSHELRTPLNSIMGYVRLIERDDETLADRSRGRLAVVRHSADHLAGLIDGLLDMSKIEAGKLDLARDEMHTKPFFAQLVDMFTEQADAKGIAFVTSVAPELPTVVRTDEKRLRQVLLNLLSNAVKFTDRGGVTLKVGYRNEVAVFTVEDTGPGIAAGDLERIFQPFERLRSSAREPGTGLGLTICRLLAGVMGGEIEVTSQPGIGSAFRFKLFLPRLRGNAQPPQARRAVDPRFGAGFTLLVADDNAAHREMIFDVLAPYGFRLLMVEDGEAAIDLVRQADPDVCLLDIDMPRFTGWEVVRSIREGGRDGPKIVMLSASAMEEHKQDLAAALHDAFLMKPTDMHALVDTLAGLLAQSDPGHADLAADAPIWWSERAVPDVTALDTLMEDAEIGYIRGLRDGLAELEAADSKLQPFANDMREILERMDMSALISALDRAAAAAGMRKRPDADVVLVVDDSPDTVKLLTDVLDGEGMTVMVALDGVTALRAAGRLKPDVVLMDAVMPGMDGFECCRRLKTMPGFDDIPIIFMTGLGEPGDAIRGFGVGAADYVTKPLDVLAMLGRMRLHVSNARKLQSARTALDATDQFLVATDREGEIQWFTPQACRLLERLGAPTDGVRLPDEITTRIRGLTDRSTSHVFISANGMVRINLVGKSPRGELLFRISDTSSADRIAVLASQFSLSMREAEVLSWAVRGKSNRDIAVLLELSHRTVDKHLQSVFSKMGVENRTAAAAMVANL